MFKADWLRVVFMHFRLNAGELQWLVPFELDTFDGDAYVSLVAFTQARLRPAGLGRVGQFLSTPLACHEFLNLRTYVRHGGEAGIFFLSEWIPNRLAVLIGPQLYGLPYRLGRLDYCCDEERGSMSGTVSAGGLRIRHRGRFHVNGGFHSAIEGSLLHFLVERYTAWTCQRGISRRFRVSHEPWGIAPADTHLLERGLLDKFTPWLSDAPVACAHFSPGVRDVTIGAPQKLQERDDSPTLKLRF